MYSLRYLNKHKDNNTNEPREDLQTHIAPFKEFDIQNREDSCYR